MSQTQLPQLQVLEPLLAEYSKEWNAIARSTTPLDYAAVEEAVYQLYTVFDRPFPKIVFCQSPLELYLSAQACLLKTEDESVSDTQAVEGLNAVKSQLLRDHGEELVNKLEQILMMRFDLYDHPGSTLRATAEDIWVDGFYVSGKPPLIADPELASIPLEVQQRVVKELYKQINNSIYNCRHTLARAMPDLITKEIGSAWAKSHYTESVVFMEFGMWITDWLLSTDFLRKQFPPKDSSPRLLELLDAHMSMARAAHICAAFENICFVSNKPTSISFDEDGLLHNPKGPAIAYSDGFKVYAWKGIIMPSAIIGEPEKVTTLDINQQTNVTVRRIMIELYGQERYIQDCFRQAFQEDETGALYRRWDGGNEDVVMVKVINRTADPDGTFSESWLRVPPNMRTARQAVAWTFGLREQDYKPAIET